MDIFFSVGKSTEDKKIASTCTIASGVLTFSNAQTGNIGVGDKITYDTTKTCYITGKTNQKVWSVKTSTGTNPTDEASAKTVNSITRTFNSLASAIDGTPSGTGVYSLIGSTADLVTATLNIFIACYADSEDDSFVSIINWSTSSEYHFTIYAPYDTETQVNLRQRHNGILDSFGYTMRNTINTTYKFNIDLNDYSYYTVIDGLVIRRNANNWEHGAAVSISSGSDARYCEVKNCILYCSGGQDYGKLILFSYSNTEALGCSFHDNIFISESALLAYGIYMNGGYQAHKIYNNVFYGTYSSYAFSINHISAAGSPYIKNNRVYNTGTGNGFDFLSAFYDNTNANFTNNFSKDSTAGTSNNNQSNKTTPDFLSTTALKINLHIGALSDGIKKGIGPALDSNVSAYDIDLNGRSGNSCDIGPDERAAAAGGLLIHPGMNGGLNG